MKMKSPRMKRPAKALNANVTPALVRRGEATTMTVEHALRIQGALGGLDSYERIIGSGDAERPVRVYYDFSPAVRMLIARNIAVLAPIMDTYSRSRNAVVMKLSDGAGTVPPKMLGELGTQERGLLDMGVDVALAKLTLDELDLAANPIPPSVLAALSPIISE